MCMFWVFMIYFHLSRRRQRREDVLIWAYMNNFRTSFFVSDKGTESFLLSVLTPAVARWGIHVNAINAPTVTPEMEGAHCYSVQILLVYNGFQIKINGLSPISLNSSHIKHYFPI